MQFWGRGLPAACLCAAMLCSWPASARQAFLPVSPDELKMTSEPKAPGAPAIIVFREVKQDDSLFSSTELDYYRIKILTEAGRKYADVEIPFVKGSRNVVRIQARTIHPDGTVVNFDGTIFEKTLVKSGGLKYLAKTFTLPQAEVGSILEYQYAVEADADDLIASHWILNEELFTKHARFSLIPASDRRISWFSAGLPSGSSPPREDPGGLIRMEVSDIPAFQAEEYMPPEDEVKSRVDFTYSQLFSPGTPKDYWKEVGKVLNEHLEDFVRKRKGIQQAVAQMTSPSDPPETKLRNIYAGVQRLRNTSYEVNKSEQERKREKQKDAGSVEDVWKRGYGTGVDLTWLYLALVRAAGFEAYGVLASGRRNFIFDPRITMDVDRLDSNLVLLKLDGKEIYCDPGAAFTPFGLLPWPETGVTGLRLDKSGGSWVTTTLPESPVSHIDRKAELKLTDTGDLEGKLTVTFSGLEALTRRLDENNEDEVDRKKYLEDEVTSYIPAPSEAVLTNQPDWSSSAPTLVAEFHIKVPGWAAAAGHRTLVPVGLFSQHEKHIFEHAARVYPVYFAFPHARNDEITIELPPGWQPAGLPAPKKLDLGAAGYTLEAEASNGALRLRRVLNLNLLALSVKYYPALRSFFQTVRTEDDQQIVLQHAAAPAGN